MKKLMQSLANGSTDIINNPVPKCSRNGLLIETRTTLVSVGTERMLVDFGKANLVQKARQQPEKVHMVLDKVRTDGLLTTLDAVQAKLNAPIPLGYCNVGKVLEVGKNVTTLKLGQRVVSNGNHAEIVCVPKNLCAIIPDNVNDEMAAFTVVAAIGLQGIRLANPTLGENVVVIGVGLIGLLTVQLLVAQGCRVLAIDYDTQKLALAEQFGAQICNLANDEDPVAAGFSFSNQRGVDVVLITASTSASDPVTQAARMSRQRGRIVLVGVTGLELNRSDFYEKELSFQVSCSYGPGRYDPFYEEQGNDYPLGFVRWTEQRNFTAVLDLMAAGKINVKPLISHQFAFEDAPEAYQVLSNDKTASGILLNYGTREPVAIEKTISIAMNNRVYKSEQPTIGFVGAGNYASRVLMPAFQKAGAQMHTVVTANGTNGVIHGEKTGFEYASTDLDDLFNNSVVNTVAIATQHNTHAPFVCQALAAGKHVFVEKPLALSFEEIEKLQTACENHPNQQLMVGFNRRFSPFIQKMKTLLDSVKAPKTFILTMNAGDIPSDHWTQDKAIGGGRIIGEACHYIDLLRFLTGSKIENIQAQCVTGLSVNDDKASITLNFADGSMGTIHYFANGHAGFPKERIEAFTIGRTLQLDNFRKLQGWGWPNFKKMRSWRQDKGQDTCIEQFLNAIQSGQPAPIPLTELFEVAEATLKAAEQLS